MELSCFFTVRQSMSNNLLPSYFQTEEGRERNIENRTRRSKIKSNGVIVSQNYPITDYYKFLHDKNNQSDNNYNFLHGKNNQSDHNYRFLHISHLCNYGLIAFLAANQTKVILHSMYLKIKNFAELERCLLCYCVTRLCTDCLSADQIKEFVPYFSQCTVRQNMIFNVFNQESQKLNVKMTWIR